MIHDPGFLAFRETSDRMCESMRSAILGSLAAILAKGGRTHSGLSGLDRVLSCLDRVEKFVLQNVLHRTVVWRRTVSEVERH